MNKRSLFATEGSLWLIKFAGYRNVVGVLTFILRLALNPFTSQSGSAVAAASES